MRRRPEVVTQECLIAQRNRSHERMPRYGEVAALYGGVARGAVPVLNAIANDCAKSSEPDLSALVVADKSSLNGTLLDPVEAGSLDRRY